MSVPTFRDLTPDDQLERAVRGLLAQPEATATVRELLLRSDLDALLHLRGIEGERSPASALAAADVLHHNERVRGYFRAALRDGEKDPFGV